MTFDEQIKGAFDSLTDRLRDEVKRQVQVVVDELAVSARVDRDRAVADARDTADQEHRAALDAAIAAARADARDAADEEHRAAFEATVAAARAEVAPSSVATTGVADVATMSAPDTASSERLLEAVRAISRAHSLSAILDTLVDRAGREAPRAGVLLVRGGRVRGWRFTGFGSSLDNGQGAQSIDLPFEEAGVVADAVRANAAVNGAGGGATAPAFAALPAGHECLAVPIALSDQVVAVLYADQGVASAVPNPENPAHTESQIPNPVLEVLARHAARCLEALTAFKAARALMDRSDSSDGVAAAAGEGVSADEDGSARRYARLLISEIKLYHEAAVVAGRRDRDLGARLGGEITRARVLYEQRVPPHVRQRADFFHDELVRTLANGDASALAAGTQNAERRT